jgi:ubiquitin-conjugating enzyme E2 M
MIKLFSLKQKKAQEEAEGGTVAKKTTAAQLRLQKDLGELELPKTMQLDIPNPDDLLNFSLRITPDEGN